ncbi:MAG: hypothetical protein IPM57_07265 [Oligoflexia bacterium]|nr:hypothetical protein [Oligoflexia bacterium]
MKIENLGDNKKLNIGDIKMIISLFLALNLMAAEKSILPASFNFEVSPNQPDVSIGANLMYDLVINYTYMPCQGVKFKNAEAQRSTDENGNAVYHVSIKLEFPEMANTQYCPQSASTRIEWVNKGQLDLSRKVYFEASM